MGFRTLFAICKKSPKWIVNRLMHSLARFVHVEVGAGASEQASRKATEDSPAKSGECLRRQKNEKEARRAIVPGREVRACLSDSRDQGVMMATVFDVAAYILAKKGEMTTWKLHKLVYYSQAWSLVWDERPLFAERIEAWANGPVCPDLYATHRGSFTVRRVSRGDARRLIKDARETIDAVLDHYGSKTSQWLSDLTHREDPWRNARRGIPDGERGRSRITNGALADYYGSL